MDTATPNRLSTIALTGFSGQLALLAILHFLPTGYDPTVNFVSEYAIGRHGWVLSAAQLSGFVGTSALLIDLTKSGVVRMPSLAGGLMIAYMLSILVAVTFAIDPVEQAFANGRPPNFTMAGWIHAVGASVGAVALMISMALITVRLARSGRTATRYRALVLFCIGAPTAYSAMLMTQPATYPAGLYQRLFIACSLAWLLTVAIGLMAGQFRSNTRASAET